MKVRSVLNGIAALCAVGMFYTFTFCMVGNVDNAEISQEYYFNTATETEATDTEINKAEMSVGMPENIIYTKETAERPSPEDNQKVSEALEGTFGYKDIFETPSVEAVRPIRLTDTHEETTVVPVKEETVDATESAGADSYSDSEDDEDIDYDAQSEFEDDDDSFYDDDENDYVYSENTLSDDYRDDSISFEEAAAMFNSSTKPAVSDDEILKNLSDMQHEIDAQAQQTEPSSTSFWSSYYPDTTTVSDITQPPKNEEETTFTDLTTISPSGSEIFTAKVEGKTQEFDAYELVCMIVSTEMSPSFNQEALKAQAVAAYSYVKYHNVKGLVPSVLIKRNVPDEVKTAVDAVFGKCCYYNGQPAQTVYTASSAGTTASAVNVWGGDPIPYLISIETPFDVESDPNYGVVTTFTESQMKTALENYLGITLSDDPSQWLRVESRIDGNYVGRIVIDNQVFTTGRKIREGVLSFKIKSACFDVTYADGIFTFVTYGYGHGVGMSQNGANILAKRGYTYDQILQFYFPGTTLS